MKKNMNPKEPKAIVMIKNIDNIWLDILYEIPMASTLFVAGVSLYMSEADPSVRQQLTNTKHHLQHWVKMFTWGRTKMPPMGIIGTLSAFGSFYKTRNHRWLVGAGFTLCISLRTSQVMMKTNNELIKSLKESG